MLLNRKGEHVDTHFINKCLENNNVTIYPVWTDYFEEKTICTWDIHVE